MSINNIRAADCWLVPVLACVWILYYPALDSSLFIDDFKNLLRLENIPLDGYAYYIFSGDSGFLGRPLSLFSFALQYESWPLDARAFKSVNVFIHLCNGALLYCVCRILTEKLQCTRNEIAIISYGVVILWLLHPIQLSAVLYVIQRMTLLSTFFTLGGILVYLCYRPAPGATFSIFTGITAGMAIWILLTLAVLSKDNGILLPLYLIIIEATLLRQENYTRAWKLWAAIFLVLPLLLLCVHLGLQMGDIVDGYTHRTFTMSERLLTQAVVVSDYIYKIFIPHPAAFSLFNDDYSVSRDIFHPPVTLWAIAFIGTLLGAAIHLRKRWPAFSMGIFWFFGGHLLESTFLNLELYFEHRNYLPAFGLFFILYWALLMAARNFNKKIIFFFLGAYHFAVMGTVIQEIRLWANPLAQAIEWARIHPESHRAWENLGSHYVTSHDIPAAINTYKQIAVKYPSQLYPEVKVMALRACALDEYIDDGTWDGLMEKAVHAQQDRFNLIMEFYNIVIASDAGDCPGLETKRLKDLMLVLTSNPEFHKDISYHYDNISLLSLNEGDIYNAIYYVQKSIEALPNITRLLYLAELLIISGDLSQADATLALVNDGMRETRKEMAYHRRYIKLKNRLETLAKKSTGGGPTYRLPDNEQQNAK